MSNSGWRGDRSFLRPYLCAIPLPRPDRTPAALAAGLPLKGLGLAAALALLAAALFVLDLLTPVELTVGLLYGGVVFLAFWAPWRRYPLLLGWMCSGLLLAGYFWSTPEPAPDSALLNRLMAVALIWTIYALGLRQRRAVDAERQTHDELERKVQERTAALSGALGALQAELVERRRAEEERRLSDERFRLAVEATHDVVWEWDLDVNRVCWHEGLRTLFGYNPAVVSPTLPWWETRIHPEDRPGVLSSLREALDGAGRYWTGEYRFRRADGSYAHVYDRGLIVRDETGRPVRMVGSVLDITGRKLAEQAVRDSEARYRLLFEEAPFPMWVCDLATLAFLDVNRAAEEHYGYTREEFLAMTIKEIRPPEEVPRLLEAIPRVNPSGRVAGAWKHRKKDGTVIDVELALHTLTFGGRSARLVIVNDVTERRLAEAEQRRLLDRLITAQEEERRRIARELHDDLNQRLAVLAIEVEGLAAHPPEEPSELAGRLRALQQKVAELSEDVHDLAYELHPAILEDLGLAAALRSFAADCLKRQGIHVTLRQSPLPEPLPQAAAACLYRVAQEALRNVAKHARVAGAELIVERAGAGVRLCVRDAGVGFDAGGPGRRNGGLGLQSMQERVDMLNGRLTVRSRPGQGTEVEAWVPLNGAAAS